MKEEKFKNQYRIPSTRLPYWDYSQAGYYFVTICTQDHRCYFGNIVNQKMELSEIGGIARKFWLEIPQHFPNVDLDFFAVMPNHIHGILVINQSVETQNFASLHGQYKNRFGPQSKNLSSVIRGYKAGVKKWATLNRIFFQWQPRFYDHIIHNEKSYQEIRRYIFENPAKWREDELFVA